MSVWRLQAGWGRGGGDHVIPRRPRRPRRRARRVCPGLGARLAVGGGEERARRPGAHARTSTTPLFFAAGRKQERPWNGGTFTSGVRASKAAARET
jgi:hypothetical protein